MSRKNIMFAYKYLKQNKFIWCTGIIITIVATIIRIKYSWLMKNLIDEALINKNYSLLVKYSIIFPLLVIIYSVLNYFKEYCFNYVSQKSIIQLRKDLFSHILGLPYNFFLENKDGDIISRIVSDTENTQEAFSDYIISLITNIIIIISVVCWLLYINWKLALLMFGIVPFFILIIKLFWEKIATKSKEVAEDRARVNSYLQETIQSIELVKLTGTTEIVLSKLTELCSAWAKNIINLRMKNVVVNNIWDSLLTPYQGFIFFVSGIWYINYGSPSIGTILAFMNFIDLLLPATLTLINDITSMAKGIVSINRLDEYFREKIETSGNRKMSVLKTIDIEFKNVYFSHNDTRFSIKNLSYKIDHGQFVSILGSSGSGKSTFLKLLVRLYDIQSGHILINGVDIKEYDLYDLRKSIGFVQQDIYIINGTFKENLLYANPRATIENIQDVITAVGLNNLIATLPLGLDTIIGERGSTLSGGEKQRLSIARALLKESKIIIMDEPTSAMDLKTERKIFEDLKHRFKNMTVIVIDHRLSTMKLNPDVVLMEDGVIVESGKYNYLKNNSEKLDELIRLKNDETQKMY